MILFQCYIREINGNFTFKTRAGFSEGGTVELHKPLGSRRDHDITRYGNGAFNYKPSISCSDTYIITNYVFISYIGYKKNIRSQGYRSHCIKFLLCANPLSFFSIGLKCTSRVVLLPPSCLFSYTYHAPSFCKRPLFTAHLSYRISTSH